MSPNPFLTLSPHPSPPLFPCYFLLGFPDAESACKDTGDTGLIPGSGRSPEDGVHGNPRQYSCLSNPMGRGVWQGTVQRVTKSQPWLNNKVPPVGMTYNESIRLSGCSFFWYPDIVLRTAEGPAQYFRKSATGCFPWGRARHLSPQTPGPESSQSALTLLSTLYNPLSFAHSLFLPLLSSRCQQKSMLHGLMLKVWKTWKGIIQYIIKSNSGVTAANVHS